jgi:Phage portal protein, SPP1 Gp6-like
MPATNRFRDLDPTGLSAAALADLIDRHEAHTLPRLQLLWSYYRNPMRASPSASGHGRGYRLAQERGLPARLLGLAGAPRGLGYETPTRKEVVIENDIAWRVHAMVDFMFGTRVRLWSLASDPERRALIQRVLEAVWDQAGGLSLMQDMALLGNVYGSVDVLVRALDLDTADAGAREQDPAPTSELIDAASTPRGAPANSPAEAIIASARRGVRIEVIEPTRGVPALSPIDYQRLDAFVIRSARPAAPAPVSRSAGFLGTLASWKRAILDEHAELPSRSFATSGEIITTEVIGPDERRVYETDASGQTRLTHAGPSLVRTGRNADGPPVVHIQNLSQPFVYEGLSEVEPLIPLQDELNTRLSDRASRVTLQSFKMLLAKGIDGAERLPVQPGTVWTTDNTDAAITPFGGDGDAPSESDHIEQVREALDKLSGVPPLASGVVRAKIGNLSSENALRVTLMGLLSKTARKRVAFGRGMSEVCRLVLEALDHLDILKTSEQEREVRIEWPDPLPRDERQTLAAAQQKLDLGVPRSIVLSELGYPIDQV